MFDSVFNPEGFRPIFVPLGNEAGVNGISMWRARLPDGSERILPMVQVTTIHDDEVSARHEAGEDAFDLLEEYTTSFWANDRASFAAAYRAARMISKGGKIVANHFAPRSLHLIEDIEGRSVDVMVDCSVHHLKEPQ